MRCIVTAGPTWEPLDAARRLTNFSTGRLGGELANALQLAGHEVDLFLSETAVWRAPLAALSRHGFSTTQSLAEGLRSLATDQPVAVFHAAAVSDFAAGALWRRTQAGELTLVTENKPTTQAGPLLVELRPTPKILARLRDWFPVARLTGWKYEVDGDTGTAVAAGRKQMTRDRTDACVVNGPAFGPGFGLLRSPGELEVFPSREGLIQALVRDLTDG